MQIQMVHIENTNAKNIYDSMTLFTTKGELIISSINRILINFTIKNRNTVFIYSVAEITNTRMITMIYHVAMVLFL